MSAGLERSIEELLRKPITGIAACCPRPRVATRPPRRREAT